MEYTHTYTFLSLDGQTWCEVMPGSTNGMKGDIGSKKPQKETHR